MLLSGKRVYQTWKDDNVRNLFEKAYGATVSYDPYDDHDLAVFTGGADICSFLYGEEPHPRTNAWYERDLQELKALQDIKFGTPTIGICRGAQFLNVRAGGSMVQHVNNHMGNNHDATDMRTGKVYNINSIHHQMMIPPEHSIRLLNAGVATEKYVNGKQITVKEVGLKSLMDPECIFIPGHNYLCFQGHPEYASRKSDTAEVFDGYVEEFILPLLK